MRFRAPANVFLHRAQVILILTVLLPTVLTTPLGIILLVSGGSSSVAVVSGVLVLAFCASSVAGYIIGSIFLRRGASLVRVQSDFLSSVSHELRTPMTSMRMFIEALLNDRLTDPAKRQECLMVLQQEMERLDGLVTRLIDLSRIETGRQPFERDPVAVQDVVSQAIKAFEAIKLGAEVTLAVEVEPALYVLGDRVALTQVLVNLLSNAFKYTGENKEIRLLARAKGDKEVEIEVHDNGPGIPSSEQKKVFDKFERGRAALRTGTSGHGLGLAIVQAIVKAHRGRIDLRSSARRGTSFSIFLPRSKVRVGSVKG